VQRAKIILLIASGRSQWAVSRQLGCSINTVRLWLKRFMEERLAGLFSRHRGKIVGQQSAKLEAQILAAARQKPKDGSTHWSTRKLAAELGTNHTRVARVLAKAGLQPHRLRRYMASDDPDFETKAADIIGLYLKPPVNAAVFCVDEKSAIQALDRLDPVLPLSPGRAERHGFEYGIVYSRDRSWTCCRGAG
jgi:transposase